jgi:large subunit ribosomal protein L17
MRHLSGYKRLGRHEAHRKALLRNLATSLVLNERINTTLPKAKEVRSLVEHFITLGKRGDLHARRLAASFFYDSVAVQKVFSSLAERYKARPGGYTRILRTGIRFSDGAKTAMLELVDSQDESKSVSKETAKTEKKAKAPKAKAAK